MSKLIKIIGISAMLFVLNTGQINASNSFWDQQPTPTFSVYPNPAINMVNVEYAASADYQIVISNILGTVVYKSPIISQFKENNPLRLIDLDIKSGLYLIKIYEGNTLKATKKLIVRRA